MRTRMTRAAALGAVALLALGACASNGGGDGAADVDAGDFPEGSTMARLADAGSIKIGTKFDQPLFGLVGPNGVPEGFDVEIGKLVAGELGIDEGDIEWIETVSSVREDSIANGTVDIIVATYTINDTRKEKVSFAGPYYLAGQSLLTLKTNTDIQGVDDIGGMKICTASGSTPEQNLLENYPDAEVVPFGQYSDCLEPLRNNQVHAISTDNVILAGFAAEHDDLEVRGEQFTEEPYGIGLAKDDTDFRNFINDVLEKIFEDGRWVEAWEATAGTVLPTPEPPTIDRY
ncbi:MAG: glutamate ABC transporter substrate-binding protein [Actinomycetales bacterium]|nr:glutamate ABC transporter substrate-binding protein [Actinomycetales bacterium]